MKIIFQVLLLSFFSISAWSQQAQPVKWTFESEKVTDNEYTITFTANAEDGWYVYSQFLDDGGPIPTTFEFDKESGIELVGKAKEVGNKKEGFDKLFEMTVVKFSGKTKFIQKVKTKNGTNEVKGYLTFMTCNGETCLPPTDVDFNISLE